MKQRIKNAIAKVVAQKDKEAELMHNLEEVKVKFQHKYGEPIDVGSSRMVFDAGTWVVKIPISFWDFTQNYSEASLGAKKLKNEEYATCRLFHIQGIPVLFMDKVKPVLYTSDMPNWVKSIDCQQVGYNKKGELVAYDYGH